MSKIDFDLIDIPIEFKKIRPEDFESNLYETSLQIIKPDDDGYIGKELLPILTDDFNVNNTVVINAGVGQGKSKSIIDKVVDYSKSDDYVVIIAVPYNNLIEQYEKECLKRDADLKLLNIQKLKTYSFINKKGFNDNLTNDNGTQISDFDVHILTINALLGNTGENALFQAKERTKYFYELAFYCQQNNKKLVIVFDEIHDGIHNFKEEYIFNLWNFQGLIFKIFVVSATFNEASKEVIKYLSEFTNRRIKIIESARIKNQKKQSKLTLIFNDYKALSNNAHLKNLTKKLIDEDLDFDIILYSKKQTKSLLKPKGLLYSIKDKVNLCYKDVFDFSKKSGRKYNEDLINIGTNFTTGTNIEKENHTLIIILPKRLQDEYVNNKGVFTSGVNALTQTIARQRLSGEIYIVMPTPYKLKADSLPYNDITNNKIVYAFEKYAVDGEIKYSNINQQNQLLSKTYDALVKDNISAAYKIENTDRQGMNSLKFPKKEIFVIEKGEKYLTSKFFGGDLATYTFFGAITNQFLNCTLYDILFDDKIIIEDGNLLGLANEIYSDFAHQTIFGNPDDELDEHYHTYYSEYHLIKHYINFLENKVIYLQDDKADAATIKYLKRTLMYLTILHGVNDSNIGLQKLDFKELGKILSKIYFRSCIKFSDIELKIVKEGYYTPTSFGNDFKLSDEVANLVKHYKKWISYVELIEKEIYKYKDVFVLPTSPTPSFILKFKKEKMAKDLNWLLTNDLIIDEGIISFKDTYLKADESTKVETFYNLLVSTFFKKSTKYKQITIGGDRPRFYQDVKRIDLTSFSLNLLYDKVPEATL